MMQSLGCCFPLTPVSQQNAPGINSCGSCIAPEETKIVHVDAKGKCPSGRERERRAYRCSGRQGRSRRIRVTTPHAPCLGRSPLQFKCLRRLLGSPAAGLESEKSVQTGEKKSSRRKIFRKQAPRKHTSPADW